MTDELSGRTLGRYQVFERLGRGGMAEVYRAYQPSLDRYVAIKVIYPHLASDPSLRERFGREARAVAALHHPNIVQVHDFDMQGDLAFMAMEFVSGPTLKAAIQSLSRRGGLLPLPLVGLIVGQIADALAYAHEQMVVHRDVKPANVLLRRRGRADAALDDPAIDQLLLGLGPDSVVLTDFGVARILSDSVDQTAAGTILGSPAYMSPEQGRGERADARSDIYSLGVLLYELLTGQVPFDADTPLAIVLKHTSAPLPPPRAMRADLPADLERVVLKALAKNPADRFQNAAAFGAAVREQTLAQGGPEVQPGSGTLRLDAAPTIAQRAAAQNTANATRVIAELHALDNLDATEPPRSREVAPAPRSRRRMWLGCLMGLLGMLVVGVIAFVAGGAVTIGGLSRAGALIVPTEYSQEATVAAAQGTAIPFLRPNDASASTSMAPVASGIEQPNLPPAVAQAMVQGHAACPAANCPSNGASEAVRIFNEAIAATPDSAALYAARAQAYLWQDPQTYAEQIRADVAEALRLDPDSVAALLARGDLARITGSNEAEQAAALEDYAAALARNPNFVPAYLARATLLSGANDFYAASSSSREQVLADAGAVLQREPNNGAALLLRANAHNAAGQFQQALTDYNATLALDSGSLEALMGRAGIYRYRLDNPEAALADYSAAIESRPDYLDAWQERAILQAERGEYGAARDDADELVERDPVNPEHRTLRGLLALAEDDAGDALEDFEWALDIAGEQNNLTARYGRGRARLAAGDAAGAIPDLEAAAAQPDELSLVWYTFAEGRTAVFVELAQAYQAAGRPSDARSALDRAVEANNNWHLPYLLRGRLRAEAGDPEGARTDLREALALAPEAERETIADELSKLP